MAIRTIYQPNGKAREYGEYALNIYNGCTHNCAYCYAPQVLKQQKNDFHSKYEKRLNIVEETEKWLDKHSEIKGKHIFLCFTTDPFCCNEDISSTVKIIKAIHKSGNYVQILTKGYIPIETCYLLDSNDIFGTTISCGNEKAKEIEPNALSPSSRILQLIAIKNVVGCKTFVSCEPVLETETIYDLIKSNTGKYIDEFKFGKLNYHKLSEFGCPEINWGEFGLNCEKLCKQYHRNYYIKDSLKKEMEKYLKNIKNSLTQ